MPRRIKLTLEYDGSGFSGWQTQTGGEPGLEPAEGICTVQGAVERAIRRVTGTGLRITGASRTDEGVHAWGQAAHFELPDYSPLGVHQLPLALNSHLPHGVRARLAEEVPPEFHAQVSARGKHYRYLIYNAPSFSALLRGTHWHVRFELNLEAMRQAAQYMVGTHDFTAFATQLDDIQAKRVEDGKDLLETVRTVSRVDVSEAPVFAEALGPFPAPRQIAIDVEGVGFLYKMVRTMAGTLMEVGRGKQPPEWVKLALESKDRSMAGQTAPAQGLCLLKVLY